ncbi:MAG: helix-turn-helix transcriptional regulator, partial [Alphaproteobacteria bacterium]|nr:helix-turn-helix transcriptional regulator [Alphaproteobacteria bacterium]
MTKNHSLLILSQNIKRLRKERGLTQSQLAEKINKTVEMVCQLENCMVSTKLSTLDDIADVLDVPVYQLFMD